MRKVTVDRGESGPRWPSPCIAEDRNGFTVFHLPGFAVPKIALVSSLLSPKVRLRSTFFSHLQPSTRCSLSAGVPPTTHSAAMLPKCCSSTQKVSTLAHFHRATRLANHSSSPAQTFSPPSCQLLVTSSPPVPLWGTGAEDAMKTKSSRDLFRSRPLSQASPRLQVAFPDSLQANIGTS